MMISPLLTSREMTHWLTQHLGNAGRQGAVQNEHVHEPLFDKHIYHGTSNEEYTWNAKVGFIFMEQYCGEQYANEMLKTSEEESTHKVNKI